jgi:hypothetical protein
MQWNHPILTQTVTTGLCGGLLFLGFCPSVVAGPSKACSGGDATPACTELIFAKSIRSTRSLQDTIGTIILPPLTLHAGRDTWPSVL